MRCDKNLQGGEIVERVTEIIRPGARIAQVKGSGLVHVHFSDGHSITMIGAVLTEETADDILIKSAKPREER